MIVALERDFTPLDVEFRLFSGSVMLAAPGADDAHALFTMVFAVQARHGTHNIVACSFRGGAIGARPSTNFNHTLFCVIFASNLRCIFALHIEDWVLHATVVSATPVHDVHRVALRMSFAVLPCCAAHSVEARVLKAWTMPATPVGNLNQIPSSACPLR